MASNIMEGINWLRHYFRVIMMTMLHSAVIEYSNLLAKGTKPLHRQQFLINLGRHYYSMVPFKDFLSKGLVGSIKT